MSQWLADSDLVFIGNQFSLIEGWCLDNAAYLTTALLNYQARRQWPGGVVEIGVFRGKYLSVLYRKARARGAKTLGVDVFEGCTSEAVFDLYARLFADRVEPL
ncbi:MAG: hypothetical protein GY953_54765, partial [bacterium]|nr:hypothetical protein [bacterium]